MSKEGAKTVHLYHIKPGDTLTGVAQRYRVTPDVLRTCNGLPPTPFLLPGHTLLIPSQLAVSDTDVFFTCRVQKGDTLRGISERWQVPVTLISFCNELYEDKVEEGDILLIPGFMARAPLPKKTLRLYSQSPLPLPNGQTCPLTCQGIPGLRVDAAGTLHFPPPGGREGRARQLFLCTLDGADHILPDVAKAILRSGDAKLRILDTLAQSLRDNGGDGLIFDWSAVRREDETSYLQLIQEAGRRLRPMGLRVGLHLTSSSPLLRRQAQLAEVSREIDHLFFEPVASGQTPSPPPPLVGTDETRLALQRAAGFLPPEKMWLVLRPIAVYTRQQQAVQTMSPHEALCLAYEHGSPLFRDPATELAWFRCPNKEEGHSVWLDELTSFIRKLEILENLKLQGLALWEAGACFPDAWQYIAEQYEMLNEIE
jgi:spore germination protein